MFFSLSLVYQNKVIATINFSYILYGCEVLLLISEKLLFSWGYTLLLLEKLVALGSGSGDRFLQINECFGIIMTAESKRYDEPDMSHG